MRWIFPFGSFRWTTKAKAVSTYPDPPPVLPVDQVFPNVVPQLVETLKIIHFIVRIERRQSEQCSGSLRLWPPKLSVEKHPDVFYIHWSKSGTGIIESAPSFVPGI